MKKKISLILVLCLTIISLFGCAEKNEANKKESKAEEKGGLIDNVFPESWPKDFKLFDADGMILDSCWINIGTAKRYMQTKTFGQSTTEEPLDLITFDNNVFTSIQPSRGNADFVYEYEEVKVQEENITLRKKIAGEADLTVSLNVDNSIPVLTYEKCDYVYAGKGIEDAQSFLDLLLSQEIRILNGTETIAFSPKYGDPDYKGIDLTGSIISDHVGEENDVYMGGAATGIEVDWETVVPDSSVYVEPGTEKAIGRLELYANVDENMQQKNGLNIVAVVENQSTGKRRYLGVTKSCRYAGSFRLVPGEYKLLGVQIAYGEDSGKYTEQYTPYDEIFVPVSYSVSFPKEIFTISADEETKIEIEAESHVGVLADPNVIINMKEGLKPEEHDILNNEFPGKWPDDFALFDGEGNLVQSIWTEIEKTNIYLSSGKWGRENPIESFSIKEGHFVAGYVQGHGDLYFEIGSVDVNRNGVIVISGTDYSDKLQTVTLKLNYKSDVPTIFYNGKTYLFGGYTLDPLRYFDELYRTQ